MVKVEVQEEWYSIEMCGANVRTLYIFGDNTQEEGCGGQAVIRYEPNSFGIPTKRAPSMEEESFFNDSPIQFLKVEMAITNLFRCILSGKYDRVVFPADGLGTGLSEMPKRSPILYDYLNERLQSCFGVEFEGVEYGRECGEHPATQVKWWNHEVP